MKMQGSELKRRKLINSHPKKPSTIQYRDLVKQSEWLSNNISDPILMQWVTICFVVAVFIMV